MKETSQDRAPRRFETRKEGKVLNDARGVSDLGNCQWWVTTMASSHVVLEVTGNTKGRFTPLEGTHEDLEKVERRGWGKARGKGGRVFMNIGCLKWVQRQELIEKDKVERRKRKTRVRVRRRPTFAPPCSRSCLSRT